MGIHWKDGYSSDVDIYLVLNNEAFDIAQVGPDFFILNDPLALEPCKAELVIEVDGRPSRYAVVLHEGASIDNPHVGYFKASNGSGRLEDLECPQVQRQRQLPSFE